MPYRKISQNKLWETAVFRLFHVPSPEYLGYYNNLAGQDASGNELRSANDLESFLSHFRDQTKICFKPLEGWAGKSFEAVEIRKRENAISLFRFKTRRLMNPEEFKSEIIDKQHKGSSIIAAYLEQHPTLAAFNSSSVNTMRLWVVRTRDGKAKVKLGYLRIGREHSLVDNQSSGGIVAPIDLDSGKLGAAIDGRYHHNVFREHPDHGALIEGQTIPYFKDSLQIAEQALTAFPGLRFVGADVAVSNNGPQIIEMNVSPDREGAAFVGIPSTFLLNEL